MSNATSFARLGYMMLKKESTAGTALYTTEPIELLSSDITVNWDFTPVNPIASKRAAFYHPVPNRVGPFEGSIEVYVEPKSIGHFLSGLLGEAADSTLEALTVFQHDFEPALTFPAPLEVAVTPVSAATAEATVATALFAGVTSSVTVITFPLIAAASVLAPCTT